MKVGEITFYFATGRQITEFYTSEQQRRAFIRIYTGVTHYTIIPYAGEGMPNYLHTGKKEYSPVLPRYANARGWQRQHELINQTAA
jgi:hypothetical protein